MTKQHSFLAACLLVMLVICTSNCSQTIIVGDGVDSHSDNEDKILSPDSIEQKERKHLIDRKENNE